MKNLDLAATIIVITRGNAPLVIMHVTLCIYDGSIIMSWIKDMKFTNVRSQQVVKTIFPHVFQGTSERIDQTGSVISSLHHSWNTMSITGPFGTISRTTDAISMRTRKEWFVIVKVYHTSSIVLVVVVPITQWITMVMLMLSSLLLTEFPIVICDIIKKTKRLFISKRCCGHHRRGRIM